MFTNHILAAGDLLEIRLRESVSSPNILPAPVPFTLVYEDEDLLVIDKPAGTPVHPSQGNYDNTLANGLADYFLSRGEPFVYRCINRLDRDTTGLLLVARHALSASVLSAQMTRRRIHRTYCAIVTGLTPPEGTIDRPHCQKTPGSIIERWVDPEHGNRRSPFSDAVAGKDFSLLKLQLETGRTHQIRVHMAASGHPLLGDTLYAPDAPHSPILRQALHSWRLEFRHPLTKEATAFYRTASR